MGDDVRFSRDAYVVRAGLRGMLMPTALVLTWVAALVIRSYSAVGYTVLAVVGLAVALVWLREFGRAWRREVVLAVSGEGVYFGAGPGAEGMSESVRWAKICAVELFTERRQHGHGQSAHRCVGVRARGMVQTRRSGGPAAAPLPQVSEQYLRSAGRADLIPGADGTIRWAYRRMDGWTVSRRNLVAAVQRHAPHVPVINGPDWPAALAWGEALAARRTRRRSD